MAHIFTRKRKPKFICAKSHTYKAQFCMQTNITNTHTQGCTKSHTHTQTPTRKRAFSHTYMYKQKLLFGCSRTFKPAQHTHMHAEPQTYIYTSTPTQTHKTTNTGTESLTLTHACIQIVSIYSDKHAWWLTYHNVSIHPCCKLRYKQNLITTQTSSHVFSHM